MLPVASSFSVIDSHTAGHPTRVVMSGIPPLRGATALEQRADFQARLDHLRPTLLHEPRGHAAMVALVPVPSRTADFGAFFISSYVYLDMCGHGTIGYAKTLAATGQIGPAVPSFTLEVPAGIVTVVLDWSAAGTLDGVRLRNVPSYVAVEDLTVEHPDLGSVRLDIAYGGMWYALVDASALGLKLAPDHVSELLRLGSTLKATIKDAIAGRPEFDGAPAPSVLFYAEQATGEAVHLLVLEANKFDRSPCGTGTSARLAQLARRGRLPASGTYTARNVLGVPFTATLADRQGDAIVAEIGGAAHITAFSTIVVEEDDPLRTGFLCH